MTKHVKRWVVFHQLGQPTIVAHFTQLGAIMHATDTWGSVEAEEKWKELEAKGWTVREVTLSWEESDDGD